jgi:hypothetical protein
MLKADEPMQIQLWHMQNCEVNDIERVETRNTNGKSTKGLTMAIFNN